MREKILDIAIISVGVLSGGILLLAAVKYILPVLLPFIISFTVAAITKAPAERLSQRAKIPERVLRLMMSLFLALIAVLGVVLIFWQATAAIWRFLSDIGEGNRIYDILVSILSPTKPLLGDILPEELAVKISDSIGSFLTEALSSLATSVTSVAAALPQVFLFIMVTLISLVYFSIDYDRITGLLASLLPKRATNALSRLKNGVITAILKYLRSYFLILLITYAILLTGLWVLGVDHAAVIALFVAFLDILPVIGVGTVLVPWSVFELATGNKFLGIGLLMLFVFNAVIRQLSEPRIVGKSLNLHPIVTLMLLYIGYALFGIVGLLLLPVLAVVISSALKRDSSAEIG